MATDPVKPCSAHRKPDPQCLACYPAPMTNEPAKLNDAERVRFVSFIHDRESKIAPDLPKESTQLFAGLLKCEVERLLTARLQEAQAAQPCGHPRACIISGKEGTAYCGWCEAQAALLELAARKLESFPMECLESSRGTELGRGVTIGRTDIIEAGAAAIRALSSRALGTTDALAAHVQPLVEALRDMESHLTPHAINEKMSGIQSVNTQWLLETVRTLLARYPATQKPR